jgi:hypothetical protein
MSTSGVRKLGQLQEVVTKHGQGGFALGIYGASLPEFVFVRCQAFGKRAGRTGVELAQ